jgi:hypothetical protein
MTAPAAGGPIPAAGTAPPLALPPLSFCIPPNPTVGVLRGHAELGLRKLRAGRNIAGILRDVPAYAAPTDSVTGMPVAINGQISVQGARAVPPTAYRYGVLIARAKELAAQAAQLESLYLGSTEKRDDAAYTRHKAQQELSLATGQVRLQSLRVTEANDAVKLADLQTQRILIQQQTLQNWIARGLNEYEQQMIVGYVRTARAKRETANDAALGQVAQAAVTVAGAGTSGPAAAAAAMVLAGASAVSVNRVGNLAGIEAQNAASAMYASHERRMDEWQLQAALTVQDLQIGAQQKTLAQDHVTIVEQEQTITQTQQTQARDTLEFLANRFTGYELYDWMTGVLGDAYRSLLQQAAAMLNVARAQLAFERQEQPPVVIQADYWAAPAPANTAPGASATESNRGLTGSARLLADLYQLDQFAFDTKRRKLAVSKTFSLAQLFPAEFETFRNTGVLIFATPTELFDRDFPGHYLRLIRRVRTSVIALVPPVEGIKATLSTTGISRAVIGPEPFQQVTIRREPETVALSVPIGGTGIFEGDDPGEMYLPFEGNGVDATWELRLPRAANRFDYRSALSDVLISFDYLALGNYDYGRAVIQRLKPTLHTDLAFSLRNDFPDAWYDLHNPDLLEEPQQDLVHLAVTRNDLPANLERIHLEHVTISFSCADTTLDTFTIPSLTRSDPAGDPPVAGGGARAIDGAVSTRRGNGAAWQSLVAMSAGGQRPTPIGDWELSLRSVEPADRTALKKALKNGLLEDVLFIFSYAADTPPWPE